jgi:HAD superfamily hydrolase (TIGR01450 family)
VPDRPACYNDDMSPSHPGADFEKVQFVLCDLDGVVWLRRKALPGAAQAVERLRRTGRRVLFVTNNSMSTIADQEQALDDIGIPAGGDVVTSAQAAASLVVPGERVLVCGGEGVVEAVEIRDAVVVSAGPADVVIVGLHQEFDYWRMQAANAAIRGGARFVATNDDATYPTPDGPIPGAGALVAAVATASGRAPLIAGKPHAPMAQLVRARCGPTFSETTALMVGDRWSTDGRFAEAIGCPFVLVRSGVTRPGEPISDAPGYVDASRVRLDADDLAGVARAIAG